MPPAATHVPPQNIEAEESVLGAMLVAEPTLTRVIDEVKLNAGEFYFGRHQAIFEAIHGLYADSKPVDEITVTAALTAEQKQKVENGGISARHRISDLAAKVPAAGNAKHYAEEVKLLAAERDVEGDARAVIAAIGERRLNGEVGSLVERLDGFQAVASGPTIDRWETGASFILDAPAEAPAVWGHGEEVLMADGEPLLIVAPPGVGKTTLAQQLALGLADLGPSELLGLPITPTRGRVVYVAADRPSQAARSFRRMVGDVDRDRLDARLAIWRGPLPFDISSDPRALYPFLAAQDAGTVFIDSLGATAFDLAKDEAGSRIFAALGEVTAEGVQVVVLHHDRKREQGAGAVRTLDDVYGSRWITASAGSVVYLDGQAGDLVVKLRHLKQPAEEVGPLTIRHDHVAGRSLLHEPADLLQIASEGVTVKQAAAILFDTSDPSSNEVEKARRRLEKLADRGDLDRLPAALGDPTVYRRVEL